MSRASSSRSPTPEQPDDEGARRDAKSRKRAALFPPISSLCSALGGFEEFRGADGTVRIEYSLGDQVVGCLKDLKRFWKLDENDEDRTVARIFHQVGLLKNDLVPILLSTVGTGTKGDRIALACAELIAALTWPIPVLAELHSAQKLDELEKSLDYTSLITAQLEYKAIILRTGVLPGFLGIMGPSLEKNRRERQEKDENIISLILHVFRNLAAMRDRPSTLSVSAASMEETTLQSQFIAQLAEHNIFDLLLAIAGHSDTPEFGPWNLVVLDIFHLLFRCCKVEELIIPTEAVDDNRLSLLLEGENKTKRAAARKMTSRHSRFGTTVALQAGDKKYILHKASAATELSAAEKTMDGVKRLKAKKIRDGDMLNVESNLRPEAIKVLVDVATKFVESCFNPFFSSILKDIRMERLKVKESDTIKFLFLSRFFLEFFLLVFEKNKGKEKAVEVLPEGEAENEPWDFGLIAIMTEPASIGFVTARMKMAMDEKPVLWTELHAGVDCFTQVLLMIDTLALSEVEENIDVAEILQNKLYYEGETLDMVLRIVMGYSRQSLTYLDSVINLSYVLLRMLEKYSKSKAFMYVRKKQNRASRKKKNRSGADDEGDGIGQGDDEEEEEIERGTRTYKEHAFTFSAFETTFADESVLATCMVYLEGWKTFTSPEQLKRIVSLMHRMAVKAHSDGLFFKPTVLELFRRILADPDLLPTTPRLKEHADLKSLIEFILKKFFKTVKDNPLMLIEIFYPKSRSQLSKMRLGEEDPYANLSEEVGFGFGTGHQITGEVEVQPGFSHSQQIGIAIACLVDDGRLNLVERITSEMTVALAARLEIVLSIDGAPTLTAELEEGENEDEAMRRHAARLLGPSKDAIELFTPHAVHFEPTEMKAAGHNEHYKLLMRLLSWVSEEVPESKELAWKIPASILPAALTSFIKIITDFILDPLDPSNGKSAKDLLQKKRKPRGKRVIAQYVGESDGEDEDFGQKTSRVKAKRSKARMVVVGVDDDGENVLEEEVTTKRTKKRQQEQAAFKSAQFIVDSDDEDDPERDKAFFAAEQRLRDSLAAGQISNTTATASRVSKKKVPVPSQAKGKSRGKEKARTQDSDSSSEEEDIDERPVKPKRKSVPIRRAPSPIIESSPPPPPSSQRKRSLSAESPPPTATAPSTTSDGTALGTAPKRRRQVIADSDDE